MVRIHADRTKCTGLGVCESLAEEFFELSDDGNLIILKDETSSPEEIDSCVAAVAGCPVRALSLVADVASAVTP